VTNASPAARLCPALDRSFPLEEVPEALRHLIEDRSFGKVTLTVAHYPASGPHECPLVLPADAFGDALMSASASVEHQVLAQPGARHAVSAMVRSI